MQGLSDLERPMLAKDSAPTDLSSLLKLTRKQWWILVALNISFVVLGQILAVLLGRFYYAQGGSSTFMATFVQTAGFPILFIPLLLLPSDPKSSPPPNQITKRHIVLIYISLGVLLAVDNMLYSVGLLYLSASTYSLLCSTQLAFNAVFSYFINSQKLTPLVLNSVIIVSFSTALLATNDDSDEPAGGSKLKYAIGFLCSLGDSAAYSLLLSLMQLTFKKTSKAETFAAVMEMQIYTSLVATILSIGGLYVSGQWMDLGGEMRNFNTGSVSYIMTLVLTAISWQVTWVGVVGLIFLVSSLFSNVIGTVAFAVTPLASLIVFHDEMNGVKVIAMLQALWGFASYLYQNYLDDRRLRNLRTESEIESDDFDVY